MSAKARNVVVEMLSRVEGEGSLRIRIRDRRVEEVRLGIFEPPRFFEALLRGRSCHEVPDIVARICGICPVAYQLAAAQAMENALRLEIEPSVRELRRLLLLGEWIESHALHVMMLHAPDFLGYPDAIRMAKDHPAAVTRGLELKKLGNRIVAAVGGREIHPVNVKVGGVHRAPARRELDSLRDGIERARDLASETVRWVAGFSFPDVEREYPFVALANPAGYSLCDGLVVSSGGIALPPSEYDAHFVEEHVPHSNALHSRRRGGGTYLTGPLARYALASERLSAPARDAAGAAGLGPVCRNPFRSIVVRAVETVWACDEALRIVLSYRAPERPSVPATMRASVGHGCVEAPRGLLYHRYRLDDRGTVTDAKIVPPTSQNLATIEQDLEAFVPSWLDLPGEGLARACEGAVRNHDPCISCATHFLKLELDRT